MDRAGLIAQPDRADRDRFDYPRMVLPDIDHIADRDLILHQDEQAGDDVLDQRLAAEADRHTDDAGPGEQRCDVHPDVGQDYQRGQDDEYRQHRGAQQRQQGADAGPPRRTARVDTAQISLDRAGE